MPEEHQSQGGKGKWGRVGVMSLGVLVFLGLFFADKTNLNNPEKSGITETGMSDEDPTPGPAEVVDIGSLLTTASEQLGKDWKSQYEAALENQKPLILDSLAAALEVNGNLPLAARLSNQLLSVDRSLERLVATGRLFFQASQLDSIQADESKRNFFLDEARKLLTEANVQDPENENAMLYLGLVKVRSTAPMEGILTLRRVLEVNPDNVEASYQLGIFSMQTAQWDKARQRFEKVLSLQPDAEIVKFQLAQVWAELGDKQKASQLLDELIRQTNSGALKQAATELKNKLIN
ncbi:MAG: tetratricopeptide repeat protein [Bacteroidota bacterium]